MKRACLLLLAVVLTLGFIPSAFAEDSVIASSFGWNAEDATDALQKAIDSGAKKVVVDKQAGPWNVKTIVLRNDMELVLQEGAEILAKQGEFKNKGDVLIRVQNVKNVAIRGEGKGATIRMRKQEYWNEPYEKSEWRHGVSILSSENVTLENLTIAETGGDGVYLGVSGGNGKSIPCKNITMKNVDCVANNRQGVSVISVDGLLMEDCLLRDTIGTAPEAGIDFEPNKKEEQITNVVMRRVKCINNHGDGVAFYLVNLRDWGAKLSFTIEDCESVRNNRAGMSFVVTNEENAVLDGSMTIKDTSFVGNSLGVSLRGKWANGAPVLFQNVRIVTPSADKALKYGKYADYDFNVVTDEILEKSMKTTQDMGLSLIAVGTDVYANGGVAFDNLETVDVCGANQESLFFLRDVSSEGVGFEKVSGTIRETKLNADGSVSSSETLTLNDKKIVELFPQLSARKVKGFDLNSLNRAETKELADELAQAWSSDVMTKGGFRTRGGAKYYFYAKSGAKIAWTLQRRKIGNYPLEQVKTTVVTPSGNPSALEVLPGDLAPKTFEYQAVEDGWHEIELEFGASTVELTSEYPVMTAARPNLNACGSTGTYKLYVPKNASDLGIRVVGSPGERVTMTIADPDGKQIARYENVSALASWTSPVDETTGKPIAPKSGFWTVRLERPTVGVLEDYVVTILGVPALLR